MLLILSLPVQSHVGKILPICGVNSFLQNEFTIHNGHLTGNYNIDRNYIIKGNMTGNNTIQPGVRVIVEGNSSGNLWLYNGSALTIEHSHVGNVQVGKGASLIVKGDLIGNLEVYPSSEIRFGGNHIGNVTSFR